MRLQKAGNFVRVLNLHAPERAAVIDENLEMVETTMEDIEISIVTEYLRKNRKYNGGSQCLNTMIGSVNKKYCISH